MAGEEADANSDDVAKPTMGVGKILLGLLVLVGIGAGVYFFMANQQTRVEQAANTKLKELMAFPQMDTGRKRIKTLMFRKNLDEVLPVIRDLRSLTALDMQGTEFGDEHVEVLLNYGKLLSLTLADTNISDAGVEALSGMKLKDLVLARTPITASALDFIVKFPTLEVLDVSGTPVAHGIAKLSGMPTLKWIRMDDVDCSDVESEVIDALSAIPNLGRISFNASTGLSEEAIDRLKRAHPGIYVDGSAKKPGN